MTPGPSIFDDGPPPACPSVFNMAAHTFAAGRPDKVALEALAAPGVVAERWTHGEIAEAVLRTAGGLAARGIGRGDRVLLRLGNSTDFPVLFFAANALGAVPVPVSAQLTEAEVGGIIADLAPALICLGAGPAAAREPGRPGDRAGRDRGAARASAPAAFAATGAGRSGLHGLYLGHRRAPEGRAARAAGRLGAADDVGRLVRPDRGRPRAARRRLQLDLHARGRASPTRGRSGRRR